MTNMKMKFRRAVIGAGVFLAAIPASAAPNLGHSTPLLMQGRWAVVTVRLGNDRKSYRFIVDTAAGASIISEQLVSRFAKATPGARSNVQGASGAETAFQNAKLDRLRVAGLSFRSLNVVVTDMSRFGAKEHQQYDGILGNDVLRQFSYVFDVPAARLTLIDSDVPDPTVWSRCIANPLVRRPDGNNGFLAVPLTLRSSSAAIGIIDTGAASTVLNWPAATAMGLNRTAVGVVTAPKVSGFDPNAATEASRAAIDGMRIADTRLPQVSAKLSDLAVFEGFGLKTEPGAILGVDVWRTVRFAATRGNAALCLPGA